jgi:hypothetical protein
VPVRHGGNHVSDYAADGYLTADSQTVLIGLSRPQSGALAHRNTIWRLRKVLCSRRIDLRQRLLWGPDFRQRKVFLAASLRRHSRGRAKQKEPPSSLPTAASSGLD